MKNLVTLRREIDQVDRRLLTLLNQRATLAHQVGEIKRQTGAATFVPEREEALLEKLLGQNSGPLAPKGLRAIYREILSASRASQKPLRVGYLGRGEGTTLAAARARFGDGETYVGLASPSALVRAVKGGKIDVGLLPRAEMKQAPLTESDRLSIGRDVWLCSEVIGPQSSHRGGRYFLLSPVLPAPLAKNRTLLLLIGPKALTLVKKAAHTVEVVVLESEKVVVGADSGWLVEIDGHLSEARIQKFFQGLKEKTLWHHVLGSYPFRSTYGG